MTEISRKEWFVAAGVAVTTAVLIQIPYWLGNLLTQDGLVYMQLIMNPEDSLTYWAKMLQGFDGAWLYTIPFTPEPHAAAGVGLFYVWLGQLARGLGVSLTAVWHGSRFVASIILFLTTFGFVATFDAAVKLKQVNQERYEVEAYVNWRPNMLFWICLVLGFFFLIPWIVNILYLFVDPSPYQKALDRMQGLV